MAWLTMQERRSILSGPGQITAAPKGISDSFAILKHCFPIGMPRSVMHQLGVTGQTPSSSPTTAIQSGSHLAPTPLFRGGMMFDRNTDDGSCYSQRSQE